jgi:hypothetical protein
MELKLMDTNDLNRLTNELMTAFLDKSPSSEVEVICQRFGIDVGGKIFIKAVDRVVAWMDNNDYELLSKTNRDKLTQQGLRNMEKQFGMVLGKNYSIASDGGYIFSQEVTDKIKAAEPELWQGMVSKGQVKTLNQDPYQMLEKHLGLPFFDSLLAIAKLRILTLDDVEAASYIATMVSGMTQAHSLLDDYQFIHRVIQVCGDRTDAIVKLLKSDFEISESELFHVLDDLLTALGRPERHIINSEVVMGVDDMVALDRVWHGEHYRPAIIADKMREAGRNHRRGKG